MGICGRSRPASRQSTKRAVRQSLRWVPDDGDVAGWLRTSRPASAQPIVRRRKRPVVRSGEVLERVVHGGQIELVGVETTANPLRPVLVLIMLRVAHRRQERFVSPWSADVLRWAGRRPATHDGY